MRHPDRGVVRAPATGRDGGAFAALELAILLPFVIVMLLLVVAFGRVERGRELVDSAAASAARAASLSPSPVAARAAATAAAAQELSHGGLSCAAFHVDLDTTQFRPGGAVTARLACSSELAGLTLSGVPGHVTLTASARSPLEPYRQVLTGAAP